MPRFTARTGWAATRSPNSRCSAPAGAVDDEPEISTGWSDDSEEGENVSPVPLGEADLPSAGKGALADGGSASPSGDSGIEADSADGVVEAAVQAERTRVHYLLEKEEGVNHAEVRSELQETMTENVNVFREEGALKEALGDIREARQDYQHVTVEDPSRTYNTDLMHTMETRNIIDLAEAITVGALAREEFRGAHWREQYQERRDEEWLKHTMLAWNDGSPELYYKPVLLEGEKEYEPKERSY